MHTHTLTLTHNTSHTRTYKHPTVNNPIIDIDEEELREQAASLGTPVSAALSDPSFAQVAPVGLVLPGDEQGSGATTVLISFTLFTMLLITTIFAM